jgi:diaminopimelate epimerase
VTFPFVKGHGTGNDFVLLPDPDGSVHGDLDPELVRALCDRRAGIGADGVLRVLRGDVDGGAEWFMDYRNADGSVSQMCGNGIRLFARFLADSGLAPASAPLAIDTRDGVKQTVFCDDGEISVDMGRPRVGRQVRVGVEGRAFEATTIDLGNPHAVAFVESLDEVGPLQIAPRYLADDFPDGVNVEFVVRQGAHSLGMRVFERGVGETQSCGTGACAAVVAATLSSTSPTGTAYTVDVLGGRLTVSWADSGHVQLKGPAVLVAEGTWTGPTPG